MEPSIILKQKFNVIFASISANKKFNYLSIDIDVILLVFKLKNKLKLVKN
jgi:hypothetical protein